MRSRKVLCLCADAPRPLPVGVPNAEEREVKATSKSLSDFDREETLQRIGPSAVRRRHRFPRVRQDMINVITRTPATSTKNITAVASNVRCLTQRVCLPEGTVPTFNHAHQREWAIGSTVTRYLGEGVTWQS